MIYRNEYGSLCEIKKTDFPNDTIYYEKIYKNMLKIAKREENDIPSKKAFQNKDKKQSNEKKKNVAASEVDI